MVKKANGAALVSRTNTDDKGYSYSAVHSDEENVNGHLDGIDKTHRGGKNVVEMGDIEIKEKPKQSAANTDKPTDISVLQMLRFSDALDKFLIIFGSIAAIVNGLCLPANFLVYGQVLTGFIYYHQIPDNFTEAYNMSLPFEVDEYRDVYGNTKHFAVYFCLIGIVCMIAETIQYACWDISMERQVLKIRSSLFTSIVHQDMGWLDVHDAGELGTSFTESMTHIEAGMGKDVATLIAWFATCVGSYILAFVKGWKLTLACLTFAPFLVLIGGQLMKWMKNLAIMEGRAYAKAGSVVTEVLTAIKTVMSFNGQEKESERYTSYLDKAKKMGVRKGLAMGLGMGLLWFFLFGLLATAFGYGVKLMNDGEPGFEPGNVLLTFMVILLGSVSLAQALPFLEVIANAKAAAMKVFAIIDTKPTIDSLTTAGLKPKVIDGSIELRNVRFTYPSRTEVEVLKDVTMHMKSGQTVAIVGHSGCGKSTIVQLIERFYEVSAGQIFIDGVDVHQLNVNWLRNQIGLVSQEPVLFATTIRENIQYGRMDVTEQNIHDAARNANIHEFIMDLPQVRKHCEKRRILQKALFRGLPLAFSVQKYMHWSYSIKASDIGEGYDTMVGQRGTQLSGGQKQRIAIARALLRDPKILLLDEATSALDNESEAVVQQALENAQKGRTTVVIAHRLSTIQNADMIVAMDNGKVVEMGTHAELMAHNGLYADLVRNQTQESSEDEAVIEELEHDFAGEKSSLDHKPAQSKGVPVYTRSTSEVISSNKKTENDAKVEEVTPDVSLKRLLGMNAPEWHYILAGCLSSTANGALFPALGFLISEYLKVFTLPEDEHTRFSLIMTGVIMSVAVANMLFRIGQYVFFAVSGEILTSRLRRMTFKSFLKQDMSFFDDPKNQVSILTTRLSSDATQVHGATGSKIGFIMESAACIVSCLLIGFIASWRLTLVVFILLPLMIASGVLQGKVILGFDQTNKDSIEQAGYICSETIDNVKLVASLTREDTFKDKYVGMITTVSRKAVRRCFLISALLGFSSSLLYFGYAAALTYGSYLMQEGLIEYYLIVRVFATILFVGQHIGKLSVHAGNFSKATLAASRLFCFIDKVPKIDSSRDDGEKKTQLQGNISFQNVEFHYPFRTDVQVLKQLSLNVTAGETVALVGASGCGKSTTVSLIERFYDPLGGKVMLDGLDTSKMNLKWLRSQIGFVQQEPVLFDCSIAENIAYGANDKDVQMDEIIAAARSANIHSFIDALPNGYETNVGNKGTQLSGGQKQRIAIARAMISNPRILLLDEATSALDSKSEQVVQEALDVARKGRTCIVIAHRLSTIQNADKIAIIHKGAVVEMGSHSELIAAKGIYHKFLNLHKSKHDS